MDTNFDLIEYPQHIYLPVKYIQTKITEFLAEDMPNGDITTESIVSETTEVIAKIRALERLTFAGEIIIPHCFGPSCQVNMFKSDGEEAEAEEILGTIQGPAYKILSYIFEFKR